MATTISTAIGRCAQAALRAVHRRLLAWTKPATGPCVGSTVGDLTRTKAALLAANAFLRHQLVVLDRQVKRPVLTPADLSWPFGPSEAQSWHSCLSTVREPRRME